ncbi:MAG: hypothetical protein E7089_08965 [Bacteroidales bacterium]|nr:hypothetical protein [Bacteroidales bacterium]
MMNKLVITQEIFEKHISSATNADNAVFDAITSELAVAENFVADKLGLSIFEAIPERILFFYERAVCLYAYSIAIPHLDIVLTPTGFGVVSTSNVVPASADRVNRLLSAVCSAYDDTIDEIIDLLRYEKEWNDTDKAVELFSSFFWSGKQLRRCGFPNAHRSNFHDYLPAIDIYEAELRESIGDEIIDELLVAIRHAECSSEQRVLIRMIEQYIAASLGDALYYEMRTLKNSVIRYLLNNFAKFPTFASSSAYRAIKTEHYENQKDDTCFFFG